MPRNGPDAVIWQPEHTGASYIAKFREKKHNTKNMIRARQVQVQQWQQAHSLYFIKLWAKSHTLQQNNVRFFRSINNAVRYDHRTNN